MKNTKLKSKTLKRTMESTQSEKQTSNKLKKKMNRGMGDYNKNSNFYVICIPEVKNIEDRVEKVFK